VTAASLALRGNGTHFMPLDNCIEAMRQTGEEMSTKFKETSLGGSPSTCRNAREPSAFLSSYFHR
jgi:L-serine deaminase